MDETDDYIEYQLSRVKELTDQLIAIDAEIAVNCEDELSCCALCSIRSMLSGATLLLTALPGHYARQRKREDENDE